MMLTYSSYPLHTHDLIPTNMIHDHIRGCGPGADSVVGDLSQQGNVLGGVTAQGPQNELKHILLVGDEHNRSFHF